MVDPIAKSELIRSMLDAYRVFSQEMRMIGQEKSNLIKDIITRLDSERIEQAKNELNSISYERHS